MTSSSNQPFPLPNRGVLRLSGPDKAAFLQGLISNDVSKVASGAVYACLLTPQGKFLHDFFIVENGDDWLIDCEYDRRADLLKRLLMYKLRSQIEMQDVSGQFQVCAAFEKPDAEPMIFTDPRHSQMGWRIISTVLSHQPALNSDYETKRIALLIPGGSRDMEINKDLIMEFNLDKLNGVDFNKGCYLGQEMTSRMFFRDLIKRQLIRVAIEGTAPAPHTPLLQNDKEIGVMKTSCNDHGLALMRKDALERLPNGLIQYANFTLRLL